MVPEYLASGREAPEEFREADASEISVGQAWFVVSSASRPPPSRTLPSGADPLLRERTRWSLDRPTRSKKTCGAQTSRCCSAMQRH